LKLFKAAVAVIGLLLFIASIAPLAVFSRTFDVSVWSQVEGRQHVIIIEYRGAVSLYDVHVAFYSGGKLLAEDRDPRLEPGDALYLRMPVEELASGDYVLVIEGKVAGLYWFRYEVKHGVVG